MAEQPFIEIKWKRKKYPHAVIVETIAQHEGLTCLSAITKVYDLKI